MNLGLASSRKKQQSFLTLWARWMRRSLKRRSEGGKLCGGSCFCSLSMTVPHTQLNYNGLCSSQALCVCMALCKHVNCDICCCLQVTCMTCPLHRKRAELMRETTEQPVEGSPSKRKKRESPRKKGRKQESSGSESDSDDHSPELSMAYSEVRT